MMRKSKKLFVLVTVILLTSVAAAGLLKYYATINIDTDIQQAVTVNGNLSSEPINIGPINVVAGDSYRHKLVFTNHANISINLSATIKTIEGITVEFFDHGHNITFPIALDPGSRTIEAVLSFDKRMKEQQKTTQIFIALDE